MSNLSVVGRGCHARLQFLREWQGIWSACLLALLLGGGCSGSNSKTVPVSGVVLVDGKPVAGVTLLFNPVAGGRGSTGFTDAAGQFELRYNKDIRGALPGQHQVTFSWSQDEPGQEPTELQAVVLALHSEDSGNPYEVEVVGPVRGLALEFSSQPSVSAE
jgi:hypothetical protein